ncbi:serglycin [Tachysurus fulvidraco]|uniref:serglycin n=1 Tax=Tachysurus fulvidraco TaxID=1234273 RepID=UPI001FF009BE|nr:serglycin [Tachysurus fulvidraco]
MCMRALLHYSVLELNESDSTMRFYHSFTLSSLILIYLLSYNVLEASRTGRYMHLKCKPDSKNANCVEKKGPVIDMHGKPPKISSRFLNGLNPVADSSEESIETEESGDGSGGELSLPELSRKKRDSGAEEQIQNELEGSGNFISPFFMKPRLSADDLREDNMIE